jgi:hypothetical protein
MSSEEEIEYLEPDIALRRIESALNRADQDLYDNLRLFADRAMLHRIKWAKDKSGELAVYARILLEVGTMSLNPQPLLSEISGIELLAKKELTQEEEKNLFSTMIRATEDMTPRQLYFLLEKLRTEPMIA